MVFSRKQVSFFTTTVIVVTVVSYLYFVFIPEWNNPQIRYEKALASTKRHILTEVATQDTLTELQKKELFEHIKDGKINEYKFTQDEMKLIAESLNR